MTAIAYRDGIMCADSAAFSGNGSGCHLIFAANPKICRVSTGLVGCAGNSDDIDQFNEWMAAGSIPEGAKFGTDDGFGAIWVKHDGSVLRCWDTLHFVRGREPFYALGAAAHFMMGAMCQGASAEQAVLLAIKHTDAAGAPVQVEHLRPALAEAAD